MSLLVLRNALPPYAEDIKLSLDELLLSSEMTEQQRWGCFLACAFAVGVPQLLQDVEAEACLHLTPEAQEGAKAAAATMAMNTVYYGAVNLLRNSDYRSMRPRLSIRGLTHATSDKIDFELWALSVSALSNCAACLNTHEAELHKRGIALESVQAALRIAAIVNGIAVTLRGERAATTM